jgi:iron complex outermembrane receptor protein
MEMRITSSSIFRFTVLLTASIAASLNISKAYGEIGGNVLNQASDAFGERVGIEQLGLYTEASVRGFSLQSAGNYRIDGHYFDRISQLPDSALDGVSIHVGSNALPLKFPSPSGIVGIRLVRTPLRTRGASAELGVRRYGTRFIQADGWLTHSALPMSLAGGGYISNYSRYADGTEGNEYHISVVPRWQDEHLSVVILGSWHQRNYNGDYKFITHENELPPTLGGSNLYGPWWAQYSATTYNAGTAVDYKNNNWQLRASTFLSGENKGAADFTLIEIDSMSRATGTTSLTRDQRARSLSTEVFLAHEFQRKRTNNLFYGAIRLRESNSRSTAGQIFEAGSFDLRQPRYDEPPPISTDQLYRDTAINQVTLALGWELNLEDWVQIRVGAQRAQYNKSISLYERADRTFSRPWMSDAAIAIPFREDWIIYSTFTSGLVEQGVAPRNAVNSNEVLPVVRAKQFELGFQGRTQKGLSLAGAAFEISKPTSTFDATGRFGLMGRVQHRGVELSVKGNLLQGLSLAAGIVALEPRLAGPLVTSGQIAPYPLGVPKVAAQITTDYRLTSIQGLSWDTQIDYAGSRVANLNGQLRTPARTTISLGGRYQFKIRDMTAILRLRVQNVADVKGWTADGAGLLSRVPARSYQLTLAITGRSDPR